MPTGYIVGLDHTEVTGYNDEGDEIATIKTRCLGNHAEWITNKEARKELKEVYGATKIKRRNVWKFEPLEDGVDNA